MKEPGSQHKRVIQRPGNDHQRHSEEIMQSHDERAKRPTQQVGSFVHIADQVIASRRQLLKERVCVSIKGQVFYAPFSWGAGNKKRQQRRKAGLHVTVKENYISRCSLISL